MYGRFFDKDLFEHRIFNVTADAFEKAHFYAIIVPKNISILSAQGLDFCCILMYYVENMRRYHEKFRKFGAKI